MTLSRITADSIATGAITANNLGTLDSLVVANNVTAGGFLGDVTGDVTGTIQTAAQPNITSVGTLSSLAVTADITSANIITSGTINASAFKGDGSQLTNAGSTVATQTSGPDLLVAFTGITSGTMTSANVSSFLTFNPSTGTLSANSFSGDGSGLTGAGATLANDAVSTTDLSVVFTGLDTGSLTTANVASGVFTFNPSTGVAKATQFTATSDVALKDNVANLTDALDKVMQLDGVSFEWKNNHRPSVGVIAQTVESILPEAVETDSKGIKSVNYNALIGLLIEAVKELNNRIDKR